MRSKWSNKDAQAFAKKYGKRWGKDLALRTYTSRLLGQEPGLVLHGGGNTSLKGNTTTVLGESQSTLFVKASGKDLAGIEPEEMIPLDQDYLIRLGKLRRLSDTAMASEFRMHGLRTDAALPSVETLVHALIPHKFIDHTHPWSVLALTNRVGAEKILQQVLGKNVMVIPYVRAGFDLALALARAVKKNPHAIGAVLMHHGLITWGSHAKESYRATIGLVTRAEAFLARNPSRSSKTSLLTIPKAEARYRVLAPLIRGLLSPPSTGQLPARVVLQQLITKEILSILKAKDGKKIALSAPLTPDFIIRTGAYPLWIEKPDYENPSSLRKQLTTAIKTYASQYRARIHRNRPELQTDGLPKVILLPGLGAICAGKDNREAMIARDITKQNLLAKVTIRDSGGTYRGLSEDHLIDMECHNFQQAKLGQTSLRPLTGSIALVTGSAGAIGSGITRALLDQGCNVAVTDLGGKQLDNNVHELQKTYGDHVLGVVLDVTDPISVSNGFEEIVQKWGGVDLIVINAGIAHVSSLEDMDIEAFRRLERVNVEGTLLVLGEAARHFRAQNTGGDIVLITTKNVFAPGAKFGAYSATKASSHQLARIASLELAEIGVRVNMVAPDAVFGNGEKKSGLWQQVGPDRMKARGLDQKGLEEYYRERSLLKTRITPEDVARAVLFFATRQTPTTGATLPVDGGLPDATPR